MYLYSLTRSKACDENNKAYITYGIKVTDELGNVIRHLENVFFDEQVAKKFIDTCNDCMLSDIHLDDVIEDALT